MKKYLKQAVCMLILWLGLTGCVALLEQDLRKATLVTEIEFGSSKTYTRTLTPPAGSANLIIAVPNYRCAAVEDGPIYFAVRVDAKVILNERKRLSELTWSYGEGSCDAYGYVRGNNISIKEGEVPVTFEIDVSQVKSTPQRAASVWLVYGGRVPPKLFGERR
jgi:hypothetical protein